MGPGRGHSLYERNPFTHYALHMDRDLDQTDWRILAELQRDGRISFNRLARLVNLSPPAVADRVRRMEEAGVIDGYQANVDPARAGLPLTAFVQLRCALGRCLLKTTTADDYPEVTEVHKLSGTSCTMLKVRTASMAHLEELLERLGRHGEMNSHVVLSTQYDNRPVQPPPAVTTPATQSTGWRR
jgi:Lrp/AsnC family transcriptional regulator, leucine-responsive regulatory protein